MKRRYRSSRGQSLILLGAVIAFCAVAVLAAFAFDAGRVEIAREQLTGACDAAALSSVCTLAGSDIAQAQVAHTHAINLALNSFKQNYVMGQTLQTAVQGPANGNPAVNQSIVNIEILDPHNNYQPVSLGDAKGKVVRVNGSYGLEPVFAKFLGVDKIVIRSTGTGGIPQLDLILCFDVSGSMDDQTLVTFVRRQWDAGSGRNVYIVPPTNGSSPAGPSAQGKISEVVGSAPSGTAVNGCFPQALENANFVGQPYPVKYPLDFSEEGTAPGLRGASNAGSPPGNFPSGGATSGVGGVHTFTDLVVNIDGNAQFQGLSVDGYDFPNVAALVEASRGNLENAAVFNASKANTALPMITPKAGYKAKYFELAAQKLQPIQDGRFAAQYFLNIMNINTDAHFGFVSFSTIAGTSPTYSMPQSNVSAYYGPGGVGDFLIPTIDLNKNQTEFNPVIDAIGSTMNTGATNIGDAINTAVKQLKAEHRPISKQVIVLFTDGMPTQGGPLSADPWQNARQAAVKAHEAGIPVFTLGLAQNKEIIPFETEILNDTNPDPGSGGVAAIAGNGSRFYLVTDSSKLRATFENVARQLVQLIDTEVN